jgi:aryl-alcohol dehydrogenase-like predicted oxidoreductase
MNNTALWDFFIMKILIQHTGTQLYVRNSAIWTRNAFEARDFEHSQKAVEFAREHNLSDVQIAVKFIDSQHDIVAPLPTVQTHAAISAQRAA